MQSQVIVALDGSTEAEAILPHALFIALQTQSVLTLLRVIMPPGEPEYVAQYIPDDWYEGEVSWTKNYLAGPRRPRAHPARGGNVCRGRYQLLCSAIR